jgi:hypothetical protein
VSVQYLVGDTREQTATIADGSVSLVACSPPFIALRSYLPADHPMKHAEIGSEPDPATFLDTLLALTAEWGRVLAPWGSIAIELGDTYAGGGLGFKTGDATWRPNSEADGKRWNDTPTAKDGPGWPRPKCLALVPQLYAASLAYGRNLLTGEPSPAGQWLVRNMIVWHRPNPAVGALGDKYRPSTSYITVATRSPKRWFDLTAVRAPGPDPKPSQRGATEFERNGDLGKARNGTVGMDRNPAGAPPLDAWFDEHDTWTLTTQPSSLAHYAMWPAKLAERLVLSMCPAEVCNVCGEPRRRVEATERTDAKGRSLDGRQFRATRETMGTLRDYEYLLDDAPTPSFRTTKHLIGWTDCGHDDYRPGVVLDPFAGTGTTLAVADCHGRDAIGIDIDERNHALYPARCAEVRKALFGTRPETPGQLDLFGGAA